MMQTMDTARDVIRQAETALGVTFHRESTGGGCCVAAARLEGGLVVALCDDNLSIDFGAYGPDYGVQIGVYTETAWNDGGDALADGYTLDLHAVGSAVLTAVGSAVVTLREEQGR